MQQCVGASGLETMATAYRYRRRVRMWSLLFNTDCCPPPSLLDDDGDDIRTLSSGRDHCDPAKPCREAVGKGADAEAEAEKWNKIGAMPRGKILKLIADDLTPDEATKRRSNVVRERHIRRKS